MLTDSSTGTLPARSGGELLRVLADMGHGDELVIADANFTAVTLAAGKPLITLPGVGVQRTLEAIEAVIEKRASIDQERYKINNRELWRTPIPELLVMRDRYRSELRRLKAAMELV